PDDEKRKRRPTAARSDGVGDSQVLEGLEAVRRRPGMYIGTTHLRGPHHLGREVLDNSIDEAMNGTCDRIDLWIHKTNEITVADNGRGIPAGPHPTQKDAKGKAMDALQVVMTILHAGGKFGGAGYKVTGGLHGVGVSVVNALASEMVVEVHRDGKIFTQSYERGKPTGAVRAITKPQLPTPPAVQWRRPALVTGTVTRFTPDKELFVMIAWDTTIITQWLRETAYLNKRLWLSLHDERTAAEENYYFDGGVISFVRHLNRSHENLHPKPVYVERTFENNTIAEVALQYNDTFAEKAYTINETAQWVSLWRHLSFGTRTYWGLGGALDREILHDLAAGTSASRDERVVGLVAGVDTRRQQLLSEGPSQGQSLRLFAEPSNGLQGAYSGNFYRGDWRAHLPAGKTVVSLRWNRAYSQPQAEPLQLGDVCPL